VLVKHKTISSKGNKVFHTKPYRNTKSSVRRISKEVVIPKGDPVKSNIGKMKRLVVNKELEADVEGNESEEADVEGNESEEFDESENDNESDRAEESEEDKEKADVEGNESEEDDESEKDNESDKSEESEEDKESEVAEEVVKDVKTKVIEGKGTNGNNNGVVSKAKKRKYVFDYSKEEKVSKPKKVYKKKKQVFESFSSYEDEKTLKIKKKHSKKKSKKPLIAEQFKKIKYLNDLLGLRSRTVPSSLFATIRDSQSFMSDIGFSLLHNVYIDTLPQRFASFVVRAFSASSYEFKLEKGIIRVTPEKVYKILGVPLGGTSISKLPEIPLDDPFVKEWFKQFDLKPLKKIRACDIAEKLVLTKTVDFIFKVNFLILFANVMGTADTMKAIVNLTVLSVFAKIQTLRELIGVGSYTNVLKAVLNRILLVTFCSMIEEKISMISAEKIALEDLLKNANAEFPNDEKVIELCEKYRRLFKEYVFVEDFQAHIDDSDNNDDGGGGKNDDHGSDNVGKKKSQGEDDVNEEPEDMLEEESFTQWIEKNIDWVGEEDLFVWPRAVQPISVVETVFQTRSGHDLSFVLLNMERLAPRLWIDANVIDCWVAILNHEELIRGCPSPRRHFFPPIKAIIEGTIDEEQQWEVFSNEISAQFEHDVSSISLSEVDLNHSDFGVFTMIHLEHYFGKPVGQWDLGFCEESDEQVLMLGRMRFKIATKILLHDFNVHAEKMLNLAFKFESENDEQTRISIIVNAIKNRDERDLAKTNTFVENQ
nr:ubiquitin-specific protease 13 [Tanacetum cinerariifolium]